MCYSCILVTLHQSFLFQLALGLEPSATSVEESGVTMVTIFRKEQRTVRVTERFLNLSGDFLISRVPRFRAGKMQHAATTC